MHNAIILAFLRPATSGAKANGNVKKAVVPNHSHNLPETEKVRPRLAETGSLRLGVASGAHVQTRSCTQDAKGAQLLQKLGAQENRGCQ